MNLERQPLTALLRALSFTFSIVPDSHQVTLKLRLGPRSHRMRFQVVDASDDAQPHSEMLASAIRGPVSAFHQAVAPTRQVDVVITLDQAGQWKATSTQQNNPAHIALRALPLRGGDVTLPEMTKDRIDELSSGWEIRSHAYQAADGADDDLIAGLATALGQPVPPELEAFLRLANGADLSDYEAAEELPFAWELLDAKRIARAYDNQTGVARDFSMNRIGLTNGVEGATQLRQYHTGWIPFAFDGSGVHLGIDTVPARTAPRDRSSRSATRHGTAPRSSRTHWPTYSQDGWCPR